MWSFLWRLIVQYGLAEIQDFSIFSLNNTTFSSFLHPHKVDHFDPTNQLENALAITGHKMSPAMALSSLWITTFLYCFCFFWMNFSTQAFIFIESQYCFVFSLILPAIKLACCSGRQPTKKSRTIKFFIQPQIKKGDFRLPIFQHFLTGFLTTTFFTAFFAIKNSYFVNI